MKVRFKDKNNERDYLVLHECGEYFILDAHAVYPDCKLAVWKSTVEIVSETFSIGQKFSIGGVEYILAQPIANMVCLISLKGGNRFRDPTYVKEAHKVSAEVMRSIAGDNWTQLS